MKWSEELKMESIKKRQQLMMTDGGMARALGQNGR